MKNKKGFVYFIEIIFTVLIVLLIVSGFISSRQEVFRYKQVTDLREEAWHVLKNLDEASALEKLNSLEIRDYIRESLYSTVGFEIEYYNSTMCHNISVDGDLSAGAASCNGINTTTEQDIISVIYTGINKSKADSYRLYLWQRL